MSISRKDKIELAHEEAIDEHVFWWVSRIDPNELPPEAKLRSEIITPFKVEEDKKAKTSTHSINKAYKKLPEDLENPPPPDYILKNNIPGSLISQLEAICSGIYELFAPENVPKVHAVYDYVDEVKGYVPVGVISKYIYNWKTNRDDPLTEADTHIELISAALNDEIKKQKTTIIDAMQPLLEALDRTPDPNATYLSYGYQCAANFFNSYRANTGVSLHEYIASLIKNNNLNEKTLNELMDKLSARHKSTLTKIKSNVTDPLELKTQEKYLKEIDALENVMDILQDVFDAPIDLNFKFEQLDDIIKEKNRKLAAERGIKLKKGQDIYLAERHEDSILTEEVDGELFSAKVKDLKNFRNVKRQAIALVFRYLMQDTDGHNQNMSKDGWIIDFDMAKLRILFRYRDPSLKDKYLRQPNELTFVITANDILNFPDLSDADFYYWVAKITRIPDQVTSGGSLIDVFPRNYFRQHDNEVFRNLKRNAIFVPNKYKGFLKYVVADAEMVFNVGMTHIQKNIHEGKSEAEILKLLNEITADEDAHMKAAHRELVKLPHFRKYMEKHGEKTLALVLKEFTELREKKLSKLGEQPHYKKLIESISLEKIKNKHIELLVDCRLETIKEQFIKRLGKEQIMPLRVSILRDLSKNADKMCGIFSSNEHAVKVVCKKIEELLKEFPKSLTNDQKQLTELFGKTQSLIFYMSVLAQRSPELKTLLRDKVAILNTRSKQLSDKLQVFKIKPIIPAKINSSVNGSVNRFVSSK